MKRQDNVKRVLKICGGTWENASRDKRELSLYQEMGCDVAVLAKGNLDDKGRKETIDGFTVYRYTTKPLGEKIPNAINRTISLFAWSCFAKKLNPDIISGHDLLPGLTIAWLSSILSKKKIKLIYDSHEFEVGRYAKRGAVAVRLVKWWEGVLIRKSAFTIVVNQSIAEEIKKIHKLRSLPVVIRSTPYYWSINTKVCDEQREKLLHMFDNGIERLIMFHGNIGKGNGIEDIIPILIERPKIGLVLLGKRTDDEFYQYLIAHIRKYNVANQVRFLPAVNIEELWKYVGAVDIELMPIVPIVESYYYVLPNKMFEAIQAETPIIASDLPEMKSIINKYNIGMACKPNDSTELGKCVDEMLYNEKRYLEYKTNLKKAKEDLCWEKEKTVLIDAYLKYIGR